MIVIEESLLASSRANLVAAVQAMEDGFDTDFDAAKFAVTFASVQAQQAIAEAAYAQAEATRAQTLVLERMERNRQTRTVGL